MTSPADIGISGDRLRFLIDCDPGHDDALAILYAAAHLKLVGITTVFGNQSVAHTTRNALAVCTLGGLCVPVAAGAAGPLTGPPVDGSDVHGKTGLDGADLPAPDRDAVSETAAEAIVAASHAHAGDLVVIATGPLTNLATAIAADPTLPSRLAAISAMGGTIGAGNITPVAEINIFADPEAAAVVMACGAPLWLVGLNVTTTLGATPEAIDRLEAHGGRVAGILAGLFGFYLGRQRELYGRNLAPFHDVCAVLPFTRPELVQHRAAHVDVELDGTLTRGMTVADFRGIPDLAQAHIRPSRPANAHVALAADADMAVRHILDTVLSAYDGRPFVVD